MQNRFLSLSISILVGFWVLIQPVHSRQLLQVKGYIYNIETNEPVFNANIVVAETLQGTSSDGEGYFQLRLAAGEYNIIISSLGFSEKKIVVNVPDAGPDRMRIGLVPEKLEIEGVDVYGVLNLTGLDSSVTMEPISILPSITRLSAGEIERQGAVTLTDAFKYVPGGWTESRGRKTKQFFSVRGQKYPYPDYSINGIWQKEFEETVYFFSALDIESIEIVRSSSALVKGLTGLSGVVDVKTKTPEGETASLLAKYGEQNNYVTNLRYGNKINDVSFSASAAHFGTDGPPGRNGRERIYNFHGNADWRVSRKLQLYAGSVYIGGLRELVMIEEPGAPNIANRQEKFDPVRSLLSYVKLNYLGDDGSVTELQTNLAYRNLDYTNYDIVRQTTSEHQELDYEYGFNLLHSRPLSPANTLRIGVLYNHWLAPEGKRYYVGRACNVHTFSGVIASEQKAGRFLFDGGLRLISGYIVEFGGFGIEGGVPEGLRNVESIEDEPAPFEWQSVLGASYIMSASASLHYNFAGGRIAPRRGSLNEQGISPENEIRIQHDLGFRYMSPNRNEISVSTFYTQRQDALELSGETIATEDGFLMELYENLDKRSYGVELITKLNVPAMHSLLFANATFMKGENEVNGRFENDEKMPDVILNFGIQFDRSGFDANIYVNYTGPYSNNRFVNRSWIEQHGDFPLGDYTSVDVIAGYTFDRRWRTRVFAEVKNLLDLRYLTVAGYPDSGRLLFSGVRINF